MLKKIVAFVMICAMLIPLSPAVAADNTSVQPTIEEILNEYHQKAFDAQNAQDTASASTYSRQATASSKTLEQETVDELTSAGYEAYNVTSENYNTLETTLRTDFGELGLDPDGSYIVVISGEDPTSPANSTRGSDLTLPPHTENDGGTDDGNTFVYEYKNNAYLMRYLTVTSQTDSHLKTSTTYPVLNSSQTTDLVNNLLEAAVWAVVEKEYGLSADIASFITGYLDNDDLITLGQNGMTLNTTTTWVFQYLQVYDFETDDWHMPQRSVYANSTGQLSSVTLNKETGFYDYVHSPQCYFTTYSKRYHNTAERKEIAAIHYKLGDYYYDAPVNVSFHLTENDEIKLEDTNPLFAHYQPNRTHQ